MGIPKHPKKTFSNAVDQLLLFGVKNTGFDLYESADVRIEGIPPSSEDGERGYRWKMTYKEDGRVKKCFTLSDAINELKKKV